MHRRARAAFSHTPGLNKLAPPPPPLGLHGDGGGGGWIATSDASCATLQPAYAASYVSLQMMMMIIIIIIIIMDAFRE